MKDYHSVFHSVVTINLAAVICNCQVDKDMPSSVIFVLSHYPLITKLCSSTNSVWISSSAVSSYRPMLVVAGEIMGKCKNLYSFTEALVNFSKSLNVFWLIISFLTLLAEIMAGKNLARTLTYVLLVFSRLCPNQFSYTCQVSKWFGTCLLQWVNLEHRFAKVLAAITAISGHRFANIKLGTYFMKTSLHVKIYT